MPNHPREIHRPRRYRLLTRPPFNVSFPSVTYRIEITPVGGCPQWRLEAIPTSKGPTWTLHHWGERADVERELYVAGFDVMHPTTVSTILERLCTEGRATRCSSQAAANGTSAVLPSM